ncbi:1901_t:CDS:2, partial [Cetraspora pellucida]
VVASMMGDDIALTPERNQRVDGRVLQKVCGKQRQKNQKDSYKWVTEFTQNTTTIPSNSIPSNSIPSNTIPSNTISNNPIQSNTNISDSKNTGLIIGFIIGGIVSLTLVVTAITLTLKFI